MSGHDHGAATGDRRVLWAVAANVLLTVAQLAGGILSGSLSLVADALHTFSDAASLAFDFVARRIGRRPSSEAMTFSYVRAEIFAALINYTTLIIIGLYLVYEAVMRFIEAMRRTEGVEDVHHLHVWAIDESRNSLEAHIVAAEGPPLSPARP